MYTLKDLFNQRSAFAARLEQFIDSYPITKTQLCKDAHISRPTLDKLLAAEITNETLRNTQAKFWITFTLLPTNLWVTAKTDITA